MAFLTCHLVSCSNQEDSSQYYISNLEMQKAEISELDMVTSCVNQTKGTTYLLTIKLKDEDLKKSSSKVAIKQSKMTHKILSISIYSDKGNNISKQMKSICYFGNIPYEKLAIKAFDYYNYDCFPINSFSSLPSIINSLPSNIDKCSYEHFTKESGKEYYYCVLLSYTGTEVPQKITLKDDSKVTSYTINNTPIQLKFKGVVAKNSSFNIDY